MRRDVRRAVSAVAVSALFSALYASSLWQAISNLVALPDFYDAAGLGRENVPFWLLWLGVVIPIAVFVAALTLGRRRSLASRAVILAVGFAVVCALGLGVVAIEDVLRPVLVLIPR